MRGISNEEIVAVAQGGADRETERRVTAVALLDASVRARLREARELQRAPLLVAEQDGGFALRAQRLREEMAVGARRVVREHREAYLAPSDSARAGPAPASEPSPFRRVLESVRQAVTLPCLAPASASSVAELSLRRDIFLVSGVRIELQQLPGEPPRVRAFGDASGASGGRADADALQLTLEGWGTLLVPLNAEGRGYADFVVGGAEPGALPAPRAAVRLTEVALVRRGGS